MMAFARQLDGENGPLVGIQCEIKVWCKECSEPFRFVGLEVGVLFDRPTISPNGEELRAPIRPASDPGFGLGLPGYTLDITSVRPPKEER